MTRARMLEALPPSARAMVDLKYIDPADAYIAHATGKTEEQARSRARNAARPLGSSWPDRLAKSALVDVKDWRETQHLCGLLGTDPALLVEAEEAAAAALDDPEAHQELALADLREADARDMADVFRITQSRAQKIKKERVDLTEMQRGFDFDFEGGEE